MIRYFCDLCSREMTNKRVYLLEIGTDDTQGDRLVPVSPRLLGRLYKRRICALCAERAIEPLAKPLGEEGTT